MKTKFDHMTVTLIKETPNALCMDATHIKYGTMPSLWIPKSLILEDSMDAIEEAADGDTLDIYVMSWWMRKTFEEFR